MSIESVVPSAKGLDIVLKASEKPRMLTPRFLAEHLEGERCHQPGGDSCRTGEDSALSVPYIRFGVMIR